MKQLFLVFSVFISSEIFSQNDIQLFNSLVSRDSSSIPLLFSYPDSIRNAILNTATYPQGFVRLNEIQKVSSASFLKAISKFSRNKQKQLWEITRYPALTNTLIENKDKPQNELEVLLKKYPDKIKKSAIDFTKKNFSTLVEIDEIHKDFITKYNEILKGFPENVRHSFNMLINYPELVKVLSEDMNTTVTLGDLYKRNPQMVKRKSDSLNSAIVKERGIEYEDWKKGISGDTAVQNELKKVSKSYEKEMEEDDVYDGTVHNEKIIKDITPYPYWAGYPYWYGRDYWYPYPWWFQLGFYWPIDGAMMFFGLPTYHFGWWYFNQPHYYSQHPHASNYFYNHFEGHRGSNSGFGRSMRESYGRRR